ncbi:MAG: cytochrome c family protein [Gammaproteobacteria bacterium]|nr:cytochrome c family protein [Gammaproteobacteria bacterium]MCW8924337.1 cytochrome c family protein [Gammaproteobacteria bacterium]
MNIIKLNLILFIVSILLSGNGFAIEACIYSKTADNTEIKPPLQQALGDEAFNKAMASGQYAYTGNAKCRLCHRDFFLGRKGDVHDHAYENLVASAPENADNTRCLTCHTTGHGVKTGFKSMKKTPRLANVQCEGCHGPGNIHIKRQVTKMPSGGVSQRDKNSKEVAGGFLAGTDKPEILRKMCTSCHTKRWSSGTYNLDNDYNSYKTAKPDKDKRNP